MKRVLIVGNDVLLCELVASLLADIAVEVITARTIVSFARESRQGMFDLVIMVDMSAYFDGSSPTTTLRPTGLSRPQLFVLSWQHSESSVLSLLECGVSQYITFPINLRRVKRKISESLGVD